MMNVANTNQPLQEIQRHAEIAAHPTLAAHGAQRLAEARNRVDECRKALAQAAPADLPARQSELRDARIAFGRARGIPVPEDTGLQYIGAALVFVGGSDPVQSDWFQRQVREQARQIPSIEPRQSQPNPPPGSIFVGEGNWVRNWGQR